MNYPKYPIVVNDDLLTYEFYSEGLRGRIKKTVIYTQIEGNLFNLGFGDWNEDTQRLDDSSRTNNGDRDKVLATVAATAIDFTDKIQNARIFVEGSTTARTRLYQMGISHNLLEINLKFEIQGFFINHWEVLQPGRNYDAFLIRRK
jgi:hypothetical protein